MYLGVQQLTYGLWLAILFCVYELGMVPKTTLSVNSPPLLCEGVEFSSGSDKSL